ncbi:anti-sigma regulatory factor (Ser/Thr protein kinase) [Murinocardiopsis flavida]|uniref:Anti-sigma regulatory factor (Ser/Thr protein kinase) n=1 Tax=Murinocardiopsis flavida TaxID=645275 RepID=A0A2P8DMY7_9ACTN|nr:anti-sigma factor RsbA family regulatory protein [Murinocardiopsis flavida]PSK98574.1 anti-sigma regulatory factor (Ser/Thr protein kinase) [Murinocardiopsis flavida]
MSSQAHVDDATGAHAAHQFTGQGPAARAGPGAEPVGPAPMPRGADRRQRPPANPDKGAAGRGAPPGRPAAPDRRARHTGAFFTTAAELHALVVPWLQQGLANGDHVVAALPDAHIGALRAALTPAERAAVDFTAHRDFCAAPGRTMALLHRLTVLHPGGVTVAWQPDVPLHDPLALREWRGFDAVLDSALARDPIDLLCVHDSAALPPAERSAIVRSHRVFPAPHRPGPRSWSHAATPGPPPRREPLPEPRPPIRRLGVDPDLAALRDRVIGAAAEFGMPRGRVGDLAVAVNELAANVLEHGPGAGGIALWRTPGRGGVRPRLVCDVFDTGGGLTDPFSGYFPTDAFSVRGYGLWITRQVSDFMEVRGGSAGSLVRLHFTM